jgi:hypothetical protein
MALSRDLILDRLLLVYAMPKTGSETVEATLESCDLPHRLFRLHFLRAAIAEHVKDCVDGGRTSQSWKDLAQPQLETSRRLSSALRWRKVLRSLRLPIPKVEIITGVRELIGLALSSIFQNYDYFAPQLEDLTPELCREILLRPKMFAALDKWFDWELRQTVGIDVYRTAFPKDIGYAVFENNFARVLVYRTEALAKLPRMLNEFLGCEVAAVVHRNVGREKAYARQYLSVRDKLRLPPSFVAARYNTKIMKHFYSPHERAVFGAQWRESYATDQVSELTGTLGLL